MSSYKFIVTALAHTQWHSITTIDYIMTVLTHTQAYESYFINLNMRSCKKSLSSDTSL